MIPIFDSLTHPTPDGDWLDGRLSGQSTIDLLLEEMDSAEIGVALAVGMGSDVGGYDEESYAALVRSASNSLFPVAFADPRRFDATAAKRLCDLGYVGIKLHPRLGQFGFDEPGIRVTIDAAESAGLRTLLCTYPFSRAPLHSRLNSERLVDLLADVGEARIMLVHGGGVRLLEYVEIARAHPSVLLDLSMTMCKYAGSSIDADLRFALSAFDRRVCIGSDYPEYSPTTLRRRFADLGAGLEESKLENAAFRNAARFFDIEMTGGGDVRSVVPT